MKFMWMSFEDDEPFFMIYEGGGWEIRKYDEV